MAEEDARLGADALQGVAASLSDLYCVLYGERASDARASLTGNMLAFVFEGGLSVPDEWMLRSGMSERLLGGRLFRILLAASYSTADLVLPDPSGDREGPVVRRSALVNHFVADQRSAPRETLL